MPKVPCNKCDGSGETELPETLRETLAAIRKHRRGITLTELRELLNVGRSRRISMTAVFKRLHDLEQFELVQRDEQTKRYTVKKP